MSRYTIELTGTVTVQYDFDVLMERIKMLEKTDQLCFDFSRVGFVNPEMLILMVTSCKLAYEKTQRPIVWI